MDVDSLTLDHARVTGPYQLFGPLPDTEFRALVHSISQVGLLSAVEVDEAGVVLDGHHRMEAARLLGLSRYPRIVRAGMTEPEKLAHVRALNVLRRHLTAAQRAPHVAELRRQGWSTRRIAAASGISEATVRRDLRAGADGEGRVGPDRVVGTDGKSYPVVKRTRGVFANSTAEQRRAERALRAVPPEELPDGTVDLRRVERIVRSSRARIQPTAGDGAGAPPGADVRVCDFRDLELADGSVDMVYTDLPYREGDMPLWSDLGELAARALVPGGMLLAVCGQARIPEAVSRLTEHLEWWWMNAVLHREHQQVRYRRLACGWKPVLVLRAAGGPPLPPWTVDVATGGRAEKTHHPWQQSVAEARQWISALCPPGGLVLDPCMGSGTTGVAALAAGRRFLGCDVDPSNVAVARRRLAGELDQ